MRLQATGHYVIALGVIAATTLVTWVLRPNLTVANLTAVYLLLVFVIAIWQGTRPAVLAAVLGFLSINFFLIQPLYTFLVNDPRELLDLLVFLIVALIAGQLSARVQRQMEAERHRAFEQQVLYKLTRSFNQIMSSEAVYDALREVLYSDLQARQLLLLPKNDGELANAAQSTTYLLLQANDRIFGTLRAEFESPPTPLQERLLNTCASQAAMALYRIDLTERARKSQQFEEADRLKTAILHAVSHDLRTPITIIKTSANNLRQLQQQLSAQEQRDLATIIESEADQLNRLVGNLLDLSRLNAGALRLNRDRNSLEEVVGDVAARLYQLTRQERIRIGFAPDLPLVSFDYGLMLQALTNLVENSLRYEPPGKQIEIYGDVQGQFMRLFIVNHGPNIPAEDRARIMEPFYRGQDGRIGLGLPIAKGIVESHHGRLEVRDTPGGGATFIVMLPADEAGEPELAKDT